jgi:hypothetical protein
MRETRRTTYGISSSGTNPPHAEYSEPSVIAGKKGGEEANRDRRRRASSRQEPCLSSFARVPNDALGSRAREVLRYGLAEDHHLFIVTMHQEPHRFKHRFKRGGGIRGGGGPSVLLLLIAYKTYRGYPKSQFHPIPFDRPTKIKPSTEQKMRRRVRER